MSTWHLPSGDPTAETPATPVVANPGFCCTLLAVTIPGSLTTACRLLVGAADRAADIATLRHHSQPNGAGWRVVLAAGLQLAVFPARVLVYAVDPSAAERRV